MNTFIKLSVSIVLFLCLTHTNTKAQCHIDDWTALKALYVSTDGDNWTNNTGWAEVTGSEPSANCNLSNLEGVSLIENGRVSALFLQSNSLNGNIPIEMGNLFYLEILYLPNNQLSGNIPSELGNINELLYISLDNNQLSGNIPLEMTNFTNENRLTIVLDLSHNQLTGIIPQGIVNSDTYLFFDLSHNLLSGNIPPELGDINYADIIDLSHNNFTGNIPPQLANIYVEYTLDLSNNKLEGNVPEEIWTKINSLSNFDLHQFAIDSNNLSGCYPSFLMENTCNAFNDYFLISEGNNFDATWEDFCATGAGACMSTNVYPGDLNHDGIVNNQDVGLWGLFLYETGPTRAAEHLNTNWNPYPAEDWNRQQINNEDIKHFDTNGNGAIEEDDCQAVTDNFGQSWSPTTTIEMPASPEETDYQVMLHPIDEIVDGFLVMNVALERRTGGSIELRGGHFTVDYGDIPGNISAVALNFEPFSWLGVPTIDLWYESTPFPTEKKIEVGFTKTDNVNSEGNGVIGQLILAYDNGARLSKKSNMYEFRVNTIGVHNSETFTQMEDQVLQINVDNSSYCQTNWSINENTPFQNQYKSDNDINTNGFVMIGKDQEVLYQADRTTLNNGFSVKAGANFEIKIGGCAN